MCESTLSISGMIDFKSAVLISSTPVLLLDFRLLVISDISVGVVGLRKILPFTPKEVNGDTKSLSGGGILLAKEGPIFVKKSLKLFSMSAEDVSLLPSLSLKKSGSLVF